MNDFNAEQAKALVDSKYSDEILKVLNDIKSKAEQGETVLHIYDTLKPKTIDELRNRGFKVVNQPSIAIQKDGLYYSIYWS